ncbi:lipopolysaccharide biosynthesis protein [Cognataquiflexum aquatile]|uniref:lipopolysaccharide biosynthesis protein n=1 Tax=Cognataquiflexum aquatile TaxID=2249427 RepID=UPI0013001872|nr:oligosaccharide flippase family protein [Cognataquiflexum aquatile]
MKNFNKNLFVYGLIPLITKASGFILLPVYVLFLDSNDFGYMELFLTLFSFATLLINSEIYTAIGRFFYETKEFEEKRKLISSGLIITLFLAIVVVVILHFFSDYILKYYIRDISQFNFYFIGIFYVFFNAISTYLSVIPRYDNKAKIFTIINILAVLVKIFTILFFLFYLDFGLISVILGHLFQVIFSTICFIFINKNYIKFSIELNYITKIIKYSGRLIPYIFLIGFWEPFSRFLLVDYFSNSQIGLLNFTLRLASLLELINTAIHMTWMPLLFENKDNENFKSDTVKISHSISVLILSIIIIFSLASPEIISLINANEFKDSMFILNLILLLNYFKIMVRMRGYLPYTNNKVYILSLAQLLSYIISGLFLLYFKNEFGILGMAFFIMLPSAINYLFLTLYTSFQGQISFLSSKENILLFFCFCLSFIFFLSENFFIRYFLIGIVFLFLIVENKFFKMTFKLIAESKKK